MQQSQQMMASLLAIHEDIKLIKNKMEEPRDRFQGGTSGRMTVMDATDVMKDFGLPLKTVDQVRLSHILTWN